MVIGYYGIALWYIYFDIIIIIIIIIVYAYTNRLRYIRLQLHCIYRVMGGLLYLYTFFFMLRATIACVRPRLRKGKNLQGHVVVYSS